MLLFKKVIIVSLCILFTAGLYGQEYHGKKKEIQKILKNIENFSQYYMNGESLKMVDCYTQEGKIFPAGLDILGGKKALEGYWTLPPGVKVLKHKVHPVEIRIIKKYAYDYGYYEGETLRANGEKVSWKGKYLIVWKKVGKNWKIDLDIWNRVDPPKQKE